MWVTVSDLTNCKGFPTTERGCRKALDKLAKENPDIRRKKEGSKAFEYNSLCFPTELQVNINEHFSTSVVNKKLEVPAIRNIELDNLTEKQRQAADARMTLVAYILELEQVQPRYKAIKFFCKHAKQHLLSPELMQLVANLGFPAIVTMYLLVRIEGKLESLSIGINSLNSNISELNNKI